MTIPKLPVVEPSTEDGVYKFVVSLPPKQLGINNAILGNWRGRWKAGKAYAQTCMLAIQAAKIPRLRTPVKVNMEFFQARGIDDGLVTFRDADNAIIATKVLRDSFKAADLIVDDNHKYLILGNIRLYSTKKEHQGYRGIIVTLEESRRSEAM